jgi:hypothetical protein
VLRSLLLGTPARDTDARRARSASFLAAQCPPLGGCGGIEAHRGCGGEVQTLRRTVDRYPNPAVCKLGLFGGESPGLIAEQPQCRHTQLTRSCKDREFGFAGPVGGEHLKPAGASRAYHLGEPNLGRQEEMEDASGAGSNGLRVVRVDRALGQHDGVGTEDVGAAYDGTGVARVAHLDTADGQPGRGVENLIEPAIDGVADGDQALRGNSVGQRRQVFLADQPDGNVERISRADQASMPGSRRRGDKQLLDAAPGRERLPGSLRPFRQEQTELPPLLAAQQPASPPERAQRGGGARGGGERPPPRMGGQGGRAGLHG